LSCGGEPWKNYIHPDAIFEAIGVRITFTDQDDVSETLARALHARHHADCAWDMMPARSRKRRRDKVKRLLNSAAVERMTPERLTASDPDDEVRGWLETVGRLASP